MINVSESKNNMVKRIANPKQSASTSGEKIWDESQQNIWKTLLSVSWVGGAATKGSQDPNIKRRFEDAKFSIKESRRWLLWLLTSAAKGAGGQKVFMTILSCTFWALHKPGG